jgi:hypothetical protein
LVLNFFTLNEEQRFVDLPGYGYAKVPEKVKRQWHALMETYLRERQSLYGIILVMDVRHPLTEFDWQMIEVKKFSNCVRPGVLLVRANAFCRVKVFKALDFPAFERPAKATSRPVSSDLFTRTPVFIWHYSGDGCPPPTDRI